MILTKWLTQKIINIALANDKTEKKDFFFYCINTLLEQILFAVTILLFGLLTNKITSCVSLTIYRVPTNQRRLPRIETMDMHNSVVHLCYRNTYCVTIGSHWSPCHLAYNFFGPCIYYC